MNKTIIAVALMAVSMSANALSVVTAPTKLQITHCSVQIDGQGRQYLIPAQDYVVSGWRYCKINMEGASLGTHTVSVAFVEDSIIFGTTKGPYNYIDVNVTDELVLPIPKLGTNGQ